MPELPEVETTAKMLHKLLKGLKITAVWTDYGSAYHAGKDNIKNREFFKKFVKRVAGGKFQRVSRRGKNVLLKLNNGKTIIVHMKMTGHLLYGAYRKIPITNNQIPNPDTRVRPRRTRYGAGKTQITNSKQEKERWETAEKGPLSDFRNQFIHFVISLSNGKHLVLSDMRKFAKVTVASEKELVSSAHLASIGPEPLDRAFNFLKFKERLSLLPKGKIKQVLMNPAIVAGIGNIYSDEILFASGVHPLSIAGKVPEEKLRRVFSAAKEILRKGINLGGDSTSDYRNPLGVHGKFQLYHRAYRNTGKVCGKRHCGGIITRIKLGGRSAHFCDTHQNEYR